MKANLRRNIWQFVLFGMAVFLILSVFADFDRLKDTMQGFSPVYLTGALALTVGNQILRFVKWEYLLRRSDVEIPLVDSVLTFGSALIMIMSPGKVGDIWKAWLLRDAHGIELTRTTPVVAVERITDLFGVLIISIVGALALATRSVGPFIALLGLMAIGLRALQHAPTVHRLLATLGKVPYVGQFEPELRELYSSSRFLITWRPLTTTTLLSVLSWGLECVGLWLIIRGFGADLPLLAAAFVFAVSSIIGAVSLLPGGLGATEGSLTALLLTFGLERPIAVGATLLVRLATLWFSASLAMLAYAMYRKTVTGGRAS